MRHGKKFNHLGRKTGHRSAMLSNMACSLIEHKRINTTVAKAKALRTYIEPLITRSKTDSTHSRRMVFRQLKSKFAVAELYRDVAPKIADRPGGYTRIIKTGYRLGDNAEMCMIELVDFNELMLNDGGSDKKRTRRRGAKKTTASATPKAVEAKEVVKDETPKAESAEEVKVEAPKEVKAKIPAKEVEAPKESPKAEKAKVETPKEEKPKKEAPKAEAPKEEKGEEGDKKES
jgi:large subunit ribosomal protein L17